MSAERFLVAACLGLSVGGCTPLPGTRSEAGSPPVPPWPVVLHGAGPVAVSDLAIAGDRAFVVGSGRYGVELRGRQLANDPSTFVLGLDRHGGARWARFLVDRNAAQIDAIAVDPSGDLVFAGFFAGVIESGGLHLESAGDLDCMVGRLDSNGALLWWRSFGGEGRDVCRGLAWSGDTLWVVGGFGRGWLAEPLGQGDAMLLGLDARRGELTVQRVLGSAGDDVARSVAVSPTGDLLIAGEFGIADASEERFTLTLSPEVQVESAGKSDGFVAAFWPSGETRWATTFSSPAFDVAKHVVRFGEGWLACGASRAAPGAAEQGGFVVRIDDAGTQQWMWSDPALRGCHRVAAPDGDHAIAIGHFEGELALGSGRWSSASTGAAVIVLAADGTVSGGYACDGQGPDRGYAVAAAGGRVLVGGVLTGGSPCAPWSSGSVGFVLPLSFEGGRVLPSATLPP